LLYVVSITGFTFLYNVICR